MVARSEAQDDARSGGVASARRRKRARRTHVTRTLSTLRKRELVMFIQCSTDLTVTHSNLQKRGGAVTERQHFYTQLASLPL